jgi:hypothetical protein
MFKIKGNVVVNPRGDVMAEKIHGKWESKEQQVLDWIKAQEAPAKVKKVEAQKEPEAEPKPKETLVTKIKKKVTKK